MNWAIFIPVVTSSASGFLGYYLKDIGTYKDFIRSRLLEIIDHINEVKGITTKYWSRDVKAGERNSEDISQEAEIVALNHAINLSLVSLCKNIDSHDYSQLTDLAAEIRRSSSGSPFEDNNIDRTSNPQKIKEVHRQCFEMIEKIRSCARSPQKVWLRW